ncbi:MAG TPA: tetratricopeptide repeat protein, partial [Catenuloplanes sp.]
MPSDAAPDRRPEPEQATAEQYRQRAVLLADLGRYDEALGELASGAALAPRDGSLLVTLARVHLISGQPGEALAAAEAAVAAEPGAVDPQVVKGMALLDLGRFGEAARIGGELLRLGPDDPYTLLSGAAIVGESRNGQESLNAAWRAVQLAPDDARGHLVLAVVTARMRLFDLAERAYREALRLDPGLADVQDDVGVVRLEQRRQVRALGQLADAAIVPQPRPQPP